MIPVAEPPGVTTPRALSVNSLSTSYFTRSGVVRALRNITFDLRQGETLGLVGETGAGKSTLVWSIVNLVPNPGRITSGNVMVNGINTLTASEHELREVRGKLVSLIVQDARSHLNPLERVGKQLALAYLAHNKGTFSEAWEKAVELLDKVAIPSPGKRAQAYPHELSGGMAQRALIAMAIINSPRVVVADEPTLGLDVTIQTQVLDLLREQTDELGSATLLVTRDMGIVANYCSRVGVIYAGEIVEVASVQEFFAGPCHPYSARLLESVNLTAERPLAASLIGNKSSDGNGCVYYGRCPYGDELSRTVEPELLEARPQHWVRCHHVSEVKLCQPSST